MGGLISTLIGIIIVLVVLGVIWWGIQQLLPLIPLGEPFHTIIRVLMTIILVLVVLWIIIVLLEAAGVRVPTPFRIGAAATAGSGAVYAADLSQLLRA